jgi:hypothetical protein
MENSVPGPRQVPSISKKLVEDASRVCQSPASAQFQSAHAKFALTTIPKCTLSTTLPVVQHKPCRAALPGALPKTKRAGCTAYVWLTLQSRSAADRSHTKPLPPATPAGQVAAGPTYQAPPGTDIAIGTYKQELEGSDNMTTMPLLAQRTQHTLRCLPHLSRP